MTEAEKTDVAIIGGGPAGLSAALWCADLGLQASVIEQSAEIGGQLHRIYGPISNYLGLAVKNGAEMLEHFRENVSHISGTFLVEREVVGIDADSKVLRMSGGGLLSYKCLIVATGVRRRRLGVPGEAELRGKGVIDSGVGERESVRGKHVVVVGGGDAAAENALILSPLAASLKLVHRRRKFSARQEFLDEIAKRDNIEIIRDAEVERILGSESVNAVEVRHREANALSTYDAQIVLIRVGVEPNSELVRDIVDLDDRGYILTGPAGETRHPRVFAVGDVANPISPTLSTAAGTGAAAAKLAYRLIKGAGNKV